MPRGTTRAVFAKISILELIDLVKSGVKKSPATFISVRGIVSIPVGFLEFHPCISFFYFNLIYKLKTKDEQKFFICNILAWFLSDFPNCFLNILIFVTLGNVF